MKNSSRSILFNTVACLSLAGFFMYSVQELALSRIEETFRQQIYQPPILSAFTIIQSGVEEDTIEDEVETRLDNATEQVVVSKPGSKKVWITMGLCWGENAHVHGKDHFPYSEAALRSTQLWHKMTNATVIMQLVYSTVQPSKELLDYKAELEVYGARVLLVQSQDLPCVLTAQLVRILAFEFEFVSDEDIVVTADVDAFIMTPEILRPLKKKVSVWIWRYELSYHMGYTFMMPFIGARSKTWRSILHYNGSLSSMVSHYRDLMNLSVDYTWMLIST